MAALSQFSWPLALQVAVAHELFVLGLFCLPSMLTAGHTVLLAPFVLLYMAVAYPTAALLKRLGLFTPQGMPALGPTSWTGRVCFVTGASAGIGKETARSLARYGATVVLGVRSAERGAAAAADIVASLVAEGGQHGTEEEVAARVVVLRGDLQDLEDVARSAKDFCARFGRLDALVLNAGLAGFHSRRSAQGFDLVLGVNFLGHYALARALLPLLERTARRFYAPDEAVQPRVVCLSSTLHQWSRADPALLLEQHEQRGAKPAPKKAWYVHLAESVYKRDAYPDSKLAQLLLAQEINRRAKAAAAGGGGEGLAASASASRVRVRAIAVNPGAVMTDIWRFFPEQARERYILPALRTAFLTPQQGAAPVVAAAVAEPYDDGRDPDALYMTPYFVPFGGRWGGLVLFDLFSPYGGPQRARPRLPLHSEAKGRKLWELGEHIVRPHLERHGFLAEAWPPVLEATGGEGMELPAVPKRGGLWALPVLHARKGEKAVAQ